MKIPTADFLIQRKAVILSDLKFKVDAEDWHGVQDCASDIREIEAQLEVLPAVKECDHRWRYDIDTDGAVCELCHERRVRMPV